MLTKKELQIFVGHTVVESKMSKASKIQLLNFIQHEATKHQLMSLIMDGKIVKLDEQAKQIVEDRFNVKYLQSMEPKLKSVIEKISSTAKK